jgi:ABC-type antimicrobial peptide transport system permease subunit
MALGARASHVRRLIVRDVALMLGVGSLAGLASAAAAGQLVQSVLYGTQAWDPVIYGAAAIVVGLVGLLAAYLPARRATTVDPLVALR